MKKIFTFLIFYFVLCCSLSYAVDEGVKIYVTYIANEGFLIERGGKKILIDALFKDNTIDFCDVPSEETIRKILTVKPPFDDVDLLLFTHQHRDHFDADLALTYMKNNKKCFLIGPQQVVDQLSDSEEYKKITERIHSITPPFGHSKDTSINGIKLLVLRLQHSSYFVTDEQTGKEVDRHKNIQNLGFMIYLGNYKILHTGDSFLQNLEEYKHYRLDKEKIIGFISGIPVDENKIIFIWQLCVLNKYRNKEIAFNLIDNIVKEAKKYNLSVIYEPVDKPQDTLNNVSLILKKMPSLFLHIDIGHVNLFGRKPEQFIKKFHKKLKHIHLHDNRGGDSYRDDLHLLPGEGIIDFDRIFGGLKKIDYKGTITLELKPPEIKKCLGQVKEMLSKNGL